MGTDGPHGIEAQRAMLQAQVESLRQELTAVRADIPAKRWPLRKRLAALVGLLSLGAAGYGIAYATIPDASGVIHGCRDNTYGYTRIIDTDAGTTCTSSETPVSWAAGSRTSYYVNTSSAVVVAPGQSSGLQTIHCNTGDTAVGGGVRSTSQPGLVLEFSSPSDLAPDEWDTSMKNEGPNAVPFVVRVKCAHQP